MVCACVLTTGALPPVTRLQEMLLGNHFENKSEPLVYREVSFRFGSREDVNPSSPGLGFSLQCSSCGPSHMD